MVHENRLIEPDIKLDVPHPPTYSGAGFESDRNFESMYVFRSYDVVPTS